jgi:hypothetical protein
MKAIHSRYKMFFDYGDAEAFRNDLPKTRKAFGDLTYANENASHIAEKG